MSRERTCSGCGEEMKLAGQFRQVFQPDPATMTDGQLAEQLAAEMGGPFEEGIHGTTTRVYECPECGVQREDCG